MMQTAILVGVMGVVVKGKVEAAVRLLALCL
jgi:hypothetical protein